MKIVLDQKAFDAFLVEHFKLNTRLASKNKIEAMKLFRKLTGVGLYESHKYITALIEKEQN